jgi:hypothetical protein
MLRVSGILAYVEKRTQEDHPQPRPSRRPRDLVISLLVLLIPLLVLVGGYQLLAGRNQPVQIDPSPHIREAQLAGFDFVAPADLGDAWVPVSAAFRSADEGATLRVGYVTPDGEPVQVVQSTLPAAQVLANELVARALPTGSITVAGAEWLQYPGRPGERALVLLYDDAMTVVVVGSTTDTELAHLAASVMPRRGP